MQNLVKFGLFFDKTAHESSCMPDRPDMFGSTTGDDQRGRSLLPRQWHLRQARSLIAYLLVCMYVCLYVCHKHCFFFFVSRWNRAISWPSVLHYKNYKTLFLDFWFRPLTPKIDSPKCDKIAYNSACMTDRPEMFGSTRGFSEMADSM